MEDIFGGIGYGVWSTGNSTEEMIDKYLDHHQEAPNSDDNFILER
jgi:putative transposase